VPSFIVSLPDTALSAFKVFALNLQFSLLNPILQEFLMRKKSFIIGVTGVIGAGKSKVCRFLQRKYGFYWIDADAIVHELYRAGMPGYRRIKEYFGDFFAGKKEVNRGRLRKFILKSPQKLWILNKLMHSLILHEVNKKIVRISGLAGVTKNYGSKFMDECKNSRGEMAENYRCKPAMPGVMSCCICIEAVYFEPQDLGKFIDQLLILDSPDESIIKRLKKRKIPQEQLIKLLEFQRKNFSKSGIKEYGKIENAHSIDALYKRTEAMLKLC
jgi:dephospho-CoA kinase